MQKKHIEGKDTLGTFPSLEGGPSMVALNYMVDYSQSYGRL
jgi:hypothetical protein